jgi:hypothetical protein
MNKLLTVLCALVILLASCDKNNNYRGDAKIIGYDVTECGCCGGYMVKMDDDNTNKYYLAKSLPSNAGINPMSTYPVSVEIDWVKTDGDCDDTFIAIKRIRRK